MSQPDLKMVLFDVVGTLIAPRPSVQEVYGQVGRRHGSRRSPEEVGRRFRDALAARDAVGSIGDWTTSAAHERAAWREIVSRVFDDVPHRVDVIFTTLWDHFAKHSSWHIDPQVAPLWQQLRQSGLRIGLASNFDERLNEIAGRLHPLAEADAIFHSAQLGARKPGRGFFQAIQQRLALPAAALMMVGDDWSADYHGAVQAGWQAVWLDRKQLSDAPYRTTRITRLGELLEHLRPH
jgi:putative hydrolase of the HAD superfamily